MLALGDLDEDDLEAMTSPGSGGQIDDESDASGKDGCVVLWLCGEGLARC